MLHDHFHRVVSRCGLDDTSLNVSSVKHDAAHTALSAVWIAYDDVKGSISQDTMYAVLL